MRKLFVVAAVLAGLFVVAAVLAGLFVVAAVLVGRLSISVSSPTEDALGRARDILQRLMKQGESART